MKKNILKRIAIIVVTALFIMGLEPLKNDGSWINKLIFSDIKAEAAAGASYSFNFDGSTYNDGAQINYTNYKDGLHTFKIILMCDQGIASGTAITWTATNDNIIEIADQTDDECSCTLKIKSPGYSGLSVSLKTPDGTVLASIAYCIIHVPLEWTDDDSNNPNIQNSASNPYGLMIAQTGEKTDAAKNVRTLQIFTKDSKDHPDSYHFLRKIRYVDYGFTSDEAAKRYGTDGAAAKYVPSNVKAEDLTESVAAVSWESSDPSIVEVDSVTGMINAVSSGFARVTVTTNTMNESSKEVDSISFNVVVTPEGYISGYTTDMVTNIKQVINPTNDNIIIQTNAKFADTLSWRLFRGDTASEAKEVTKEFKDNIEIGESTGRVVLSDMPAGVYYLTAIPVKDSVASRVLQTYDVTSANIKHFGIVLIVPIRFPVDELVLNYYNANVFDSFDLLSNSNLPAETFRFSSTDLNVASVGINDGVIEAKGLGECSVLINAKDSKAIRNIFGDYVVDAGADTFDTTGFKVDVNVVNGVAINTTSATLPLGSSLQLSLTAPNPYEGAITWKSDNEKVVKVDETGLVTAVGTGDAKVTVKIKVNGVTKQAKCKVKVVSAVDTIKLSAKEDFVAVGDNLTISATVSPNLANAELTWSVSDPALATIADASALSMTITGVAEGTVVVAAVNKENAIVATKIIKVIQDIASITLSDTDVTLSQSVGFYQLYATCTPALPASQSLTWTSSNKKIVTVDKNGKVTLVKPGQAVITVSTENGLLAQCNFTITQGITDITFDESEITLYVGDKQRLTYVVKPANASDVTLSWSSFDSKVATVDASGYVVAKNAGTTIIFAKAVDGSGKMAMCKVTVLQTAKSMKVDVSALQMEVGEVYQLEVSLTPPTSSDVITYESSNTKVVVVSAKGKVQAKAKGNAVILIRTSGGLTSYVNVDVTQQVTGVALGETEATIYVGDKLEMVATISPKNATDKEVTWTTTNAKVATVNDKGVVTGVSGGTSIIEVTTVDGGLSARCVLTVIERVTSITLQEEAEVGVGKKLKLVATIDNETATSKDVTWTSSSKKIATVNAKGVVVGKKVGTCIITVTANDGSGASAECEVHVFNATESIEIDPSMTYIELIVGESKTIKYENEPVNATYKPEWTSSDASIAVVNKKGTITALKAGTTTVIAKAPDNPDITGTVVVKVINPINASNITLNKSEVVMTVGESQNVVASFQPGNITESYTWSSDNSYVATVDSNGRIVAKSIGTATVTIMTKDSGKKATVNVYVVGLSETSVTLHQYESLILNLEIDGQSSGKINVRWGTDNQDIAVIKNGTSGAVTAKALGTTYVYAMVNGRKLYCKVKVISNIK